MDSKSEEKKLEPKLSSLSRNANEHKERTFISLMHYVNKESLKESYYELGKRKSAGVDGVSWEEYGRSINGNIEKLMEEMKQMKYKPKPTRRVYIDKSNGGKRPLGILTVEDKMVQRTMSKILEALYEPIFYEFSYGFREGRNCHQALKEIGKTMNFKRINYVIEADIKGFFDNIEHKRLIRIIGKRIADIKFKRYIVRFLKAGYSEKGQIRKSEKGTPQGGNISPMLANIFLHYVLDEWYAKEIKTRIKGDNKLVRYCDDFVIMVEGKEEAEWIMKELEERMKENGLEMNKEKTRIVEMKRGKGKGEGGTFDFLGITHYYTKTRDGKRDKIGRKTNKRRFRKSIGEIQEWMKKAMKMFKLKQVWKGIKERLLGYYQYYAMSENIRSVKKYYRAVIRIIYRTVNRRSQKISFNWNGLMEYVKKYELPIPRIMKDFYTK